MKKTIITALTLFSFATGVTFAQGVYSKPVDNHARPVQTQAPRYTNDQYQDELKIDRLDALVGLSRRQEKQIRKIENNYDHLMATSRLTPDGYRQLQLRKRQDVLAILTSSQRDRLFAAQQPGQPNSRNSRNQPVPYGGSNRRG
ncbi:hypothetical protein [Spirosoma spitsbergense]|uniref:hypothetical protein n=1 Tax=Spirosoma spitsbergense TaxID=431554 RepID=UPI00035FAEF5|nr:hypothetical protein [Spirosoma spitsbergense]